MNHTETDFSNDYGPQRLSLELVNICNLHCSYCFRADDALYSDRAEFFPLQLLKSILSDAHRVAGITRVIFTGGEPTLHPQFSETLQAVAAEGLTASFVTNGWHFERVWPALMANRAAVTHVAFSLDGITRDSHDQWRGAGSFDRVIKAFSRCHMFGLPFAVKVVVRRDNADDLEQIALFAARLGASALNFVHLMPTSSSLADGSALTEVERKIAEQEITLLSRILKMKVGIDVGYHNTNVRPPCSPLAGTSMNVDYRGRLTLCCNLSGFRGGSDDKDVAADLRTEPFSAARERLQSIAQDQLLKRSEALQKLHAQNLEPDLFTSSPCLFCLQSFGKVPWNKSASVEPNRATRTLPLYNSVA